MAFTHTNRITYQYVAGGNTEQTAVSQAETAGAEMNVSEVVTALATPTDDIDLEYFEFTTKAQARSVYLKLDGFDGAVWANGSSAGTKMKDLVSGQPYVWSYNATNNFPEGAENPMVDTTTKLTVVPANGTTTVTEGDTATLTVKVLYDPS